MNRQKAQGIRFCRNSKGPGSQAAVVSRDGLEFKGNILQVHEVLPRETGGSRGSLGVAGDGGRDALLFLLKYQEVVA